MLIVELLKERLIGSLGKAALLVDERDQTEILLHQIETLAVIHPLHLAPIDSFPA